MSRLVASQRAWLAPSWVREELSRKAQALPSLDLRFAESKSLTDAASGQSLVTFTRASSGTYVGSDGALKTATTNEPRFDHNPTTGESLGLLVEEQRTNLLVRSEEFDNASWSKPGLLAFGSGSTANAIAAPNGSTAADLLTEDTSTGQHRAYQTVSGTVNANAYTLSMYVKAKERTRFYVGIVDSPGFSRQGNAIFNLSNGTVVSASAGLNGATGGVASIQDVGNGWYRCSYALVLGGTNTAIFCDLNIVSAGSTISYTGDGTSGIYLWGAQLEAGSFPTSYIPTTTATATRSADVASITGTNFSSWYRQDEGTVFADATIANTGSNRFIVGASDATVNEEVALYWNTVFNSLVTDGAASQANSFGGTVTAGSRALHSFAYKANDFQGYGNAVALSADTSGTLPTADRLTIGSRVNSTFWTNGTIRRLTYWPARLANSTLQAITQ